MRKKTYNIGDMLLDYVNGEPAVVGMITELSSSKLYYNVEWLYVRKDVAVQVKSQMYHIFKIKIWRRQWELYKNDIVYEGRRQRKRVLKKA